MSSALPRHDEPIVAIATAAGRGAIGVVRASGRDLAPLVEAICRRPLIPRTASYGPFHDADGEPIDHGLAVRFEAPNSYTGEAVLELQAHGGPVVLQLLLARCLQAMPGLRLALPGEFTERAFLNGKLDLAQAEAVGDLIEASTEAAARGAARSLGGAFSAEIARLEDGLVRLRTLVEATLDFPEEDVDFLAQADARGQLAALRDGVERVRERARQGALLREGMTVVLAGLPNVGKSSLLNALAGAELAIVTPVPGTTRDRLRETIQIEGVPVHVVDTAGIRAFDDAAGDDAHAAVERIGIERSWASIAEADAVLFLHDLSRRGEAEYDAADAELVEAMAGRPGLASRVLHVWNKCDLAGAAGEVVAGPALSMSARTGQGLESLRQALLQRAGWHADDGGAEGVYLARARHLDAIRRVADELARASDQLMASDPALELLAEDLRQAHRCLGEITGEFTTEDLLGQIFGRFCIGK